MTTHSTSSAGAIKAIPPRPRNVNAAAPAPAPETAVPPAVSPDQAMPAEAKTELPPIGSRNLTQIHEILCKPFPLKFVEVKPGATTKDKTRALCLAYVDPRVYQTRLDRLAGPEGWQVEYAPVSDRAIRCRLTILGVSKEDIGECDADDPNQATSAAMQAFKRACAAFGLGRYLYSLPQPWLDYDESKKRFADPTGAAREVYRLAGLVEG